jgi:hypothetical protein
MTVVVTVKIQINRHQIQNPQLITVAEILTRDNTMTCQRIARKRVDKHAAIRAHNNRTNIYNSLLGNSQRANGLAR